MNDFHGMKVHRYCIGIVAGVFLSGCGLAHDEEIIGPYRLSAIDIDRQMSVCYRLASGGCIGRIDETVFAVGADARFIVAKQHPLDDRTITNYFILAIANDSELADPSKSVIGPLSEAAYRDKAQLLRLPAFTRTIDALK
jgi:hypothetical protein